MTKHSWQLNKGIKMDDELAAEVYKIACGLKGLSLHSQLMIAREDCPEDLLKAIDEGIAAINKIFKQD